MAKVTVDESTCVGCGLCEQLCENVFKMEDGIAKVLTPESDADLSEVVSQCPVGAIKVA